MEPQQRQDANHGSRAKTACRMILNKLSWMRSILFAGGGVCNQFSFFFQNPASFGPAAQRDSMPGKEPARGVSYSPRPAYRKIAPMEPSQPPQVRGLRRWLYVALGCAFVGLGTLGVFLPVMPATPFFLLASWFFVRSSPRLHAWLLRSRVVGPFLRDWHRHRAIRPRVKYVACATVILM